MNKTYSQKELAQIKPLVLAYVGDSVYEVYVRNHLIQTSGRLDVNHLHKKSVRFVCCAAQAHILSELESELTEQELDVVRRGRNAHSHTVPKNASVHDYRCATGFEALIGHTYLKGDEQRLEILLSRAIEIGQGGQNE